MPRCGKRRSKIASLGIDGGYHFRFAIAIARRHTAGTGLRTDEPVDALPRSRLPAVRPAILANYLGGDGMAEEWWSTMSQCSPLLT
jgi:hypothetical protein